MLVSYLFFLSYKEMSIRLYVTGSLRIMSSDGLICPLIHVYVYVRNKKTERNKWERAIPTNTTKIESPLVLMIP